MKFPRNARIFRGQLDAAPFASVFFLLVIFVMLGTLVHTPGVRIELPQANDLPGTDAPTIAVAVDANGRLYFENRVIDRGDLLSRLRAAAKKSSEPLTLLVQADKAVTEESLVGVAALARTAGIHDLLLATLPPVFTNSLSLYSSRVP
jgi:biopolymer transport protein ExbD